MVLGQEIAHCVQQLVENLKPRQVTIGRRQVLGTTPRPGPFPPPPQSPYPTPEDAEATVGTSP